MGFPPTLISSLLTEPTVFESIRSELENHLGQSVSAAGDFNGDGISDLILGAPWDSPSGSLSGGAYVIFGHAGAFTPSVSLSSLSGSDGFKIVGGAADNRMGNAVASAGDLNGDGFDDLVVGAYVADKSGIDSGSAYIVFGRAGPLPSTLDVGSLNGSNGFRIDGSAAGSMLGAAVRSAGDINGDGFDDLIFGSEYGGDKGQVSVIFGHAGSFAPTLSAGSLNGTNGFRVVGPSNAEYVGSSVSGIGDINGDGFDDFIVGARRTFYSQLEIGTAYVVFGKEDGFGALLDLGKLDGANGFSLGASPNDVMHSTVFFGNAASAAGDVNGDGYDDFIVGAHISDGEAYLILGRPESFGSHVDVTTSGIGGIVRTRGNHGYRYRRCRRLRW